MAFPKAKRFDYKYSIAPPPTAYDVQAPSLNSSFTFPHSKRFENIQTSTAIKEDTTSEMVNGNRLSVSGTMFTRKPPRHSCADSKSPNRKKLSNQESAGQKSTKTFTEEKSSEQKPTEIPDKIKKVQVKQLQTLIQDIRKQLENCQSVLKQQENSQEFSVDKLNLRERYESASDLSSAETYTVKDKLDKSDNRDKVKKPRKVFATSDFEYSEASTSSHASSKNKCRALKKDFKSLVDLKQPAVNHNLKINLSFTTTDLVDEFSSLSDLRTIKERSNELSKNKNATGIEGYYSEINGIDLIGIKNNLNKKKAYQSEISSIDSIGIQNSYFSKNPHDIYQCISSEISDIDSIEHKDDNRDVLSSKNNQYQKYTSSSDYIETDREVTTSNINSEDDFHDILDSDNIFKDSSNFKNSSSTFDVSEEFIYDDYQSLVEEDDLEMTLNLGNYEFSEVYKQFMKLYYGGTPETLKTDAPQIEAEVLERTLENTALNVKSKENISVDKKVTNIKPQTIKGDLKNKQYSRVLRPSQQVNISVQKNLSKNVSKIKANEKVAPINEKISLSDKKITPVQQKPKKLVKKKPTKIKKSANKNQTDDQKTKPNNDEIEKLVRETIGKLKNEFTNEIYENMEKKLKIVINQMVAGSAQAEMQVEKICDEATNKLTKDLKSVMKN